MAASAASESASTLAGLGRAFGGALVFSLPLLMTMEMWTLGFTMDRLRLTLLLVLAIPLLVGLSHRAGFEATFDWRDDVLDVAVAFGIAFVASAVILTALGVLDTNMSADEVLGKIALQAVPASFGALLGRTQLGSESVRDGEQEAMAGYGGELVLMAIGALFLGLNLAPTDEMLVIGFRMTPWHGLGLILLTIALMHAFVYAVAFKGGRSAPEDRPRGTDFLRFTIVGYVLALAISLYALWAFGRTDGLAPMPILMSTLVLAFPASIGASAARLIL